METIVSGMDRISSSMKMLEQQAVTLKNMEQTAERLLERAIQRDRKAKQELSEAQEQQTTEDNPAHGVAQVVVVVVDETEKTGPSAEPPDVVVIADQTEPSAETPPPLPEVLQCWRRFETFWYPEGKWWTWHHGIVELKA